MTTLTKKQLINFLHSIAGLAPIVTTVMLRTNCQATNAFAEDLKSQATTICNFLTHVENIVIDKSTRLVSMEDVIFSAIQEAVHHAELILVSNAIVKRLPKESHARLHQDQSLPVKMNVQSFLTA